MMVSTLVPLDRPGWAQRISEQNDQAVLAIIQLGQDLLEAREQLGTDFYPMVEEDLHRSKRWAQMFMSIGRHEALAETKHVSSLPADTQSLYQLSRVESETVESWIVDGTVTPSTTRKNIIKARFELKEQQEASKRQEESGNWNVPRASGSGESTVVHIWDSPSDWLKGVLWHLEPNNPPHRYITTQVPPNSWVSIPKALTEDPDLIAVIDQAGAMESELVDEVDRREQELDDLVTATYKSITGLIANAAVDIVSDEPTIYSHDRTIRPGWEQIPFKPLEGNQIEVPHELDDCSWCGPSSQEEPSDDE